MFQGHNLWPCLAVATCPGSACAHLGGPRGHGYWLQGTAEPCPGQEPLQSTGLPDEHPHSAALLWATAVPGQQHPGAPGTGRSQLHSEGRLAAVGQPSAYVPGAKEDKEHPAAWKFC